MDDPIVRMAKAFYESMMANKATLPWGAMSWETIPQVLRDEAYDAMYAALKELREPTEEMLQAVRDADVWGEVNAIVMYHFARQGFPKGKNGKRGVQSDPLPKSWTVMIDKLLEVK